MSHLAIAMLCIVGLLACEKDPGQRSPAPLSTTTRTSLNLVEAKLATRLSSGAMPADAWCDHAIPHLQLAGSTVRFQCANREVTWSIKRERGGQKHRTLTNADGAELTLHQISIERWQVRGSPCDQGPTVYVVFADVDKFYQDWLQQAHCPQGDMKLAD